MLFLKSGHGGHKWAKMSLAEEEHKGIPALLSAKAYSFHDERPNMPIEVLQLTSLSTKQT